MSSSPPDANGEDKADAAPAAFRFQDSEVEESMQSAREEKAAPATAAPATAAPATAAPNPQPTSASVPKPTPPVAPPAAPPAAAATPAPAKTGAPKIPTPVIPAAKVPAPKIPTPSMQPPSSQVPAPSSAKPAPAAPVTAATPAVTPQAPTAKAPAPKIPTPKIAIPGAPAAIPAANTTPTPKSAAAPPSQVQPAAAQAPKAPAARAASATAPAQNAAKAAPVAVPKLDLPAVEMEQVHIAPSFSLRPWLDKLDPLAMLAAQIATVVMVAALGYILWGIFGGHIGDPKIAKAAQAAQNIALAAKAFRMGAVVLAVCSILLMLDVIALGPALAVVGIALQFGAAPILGSIGKSQATFHLIQNFRSLGFALLVLGVLKSTYDFGRWMLDRPNRLRAGATVGAGAKREAKQQNIAANATMFSPCWSLPFCREAVRVRCPAFLARVKCWKFGRGCMCDQELVKRAINNAPVEVIKSPTEMSKKKPPCGQCSIFLEHQSLKYKMISPITIPITIVTAVVLWPRYEQFWEFAGVRLSGVWSKMAFSATNAANNAANAAEPNDIDKYTLSPEQVWHAIQSMTGVLLAFFLLIYIAKFLEWAILKMKW